VGNPGDLGPEPVIFGSRSENSGSEFPESAGAFLPVTAALSAGQKSKSDFLSPVAGCTWGPIVNRLPVERNTKQNTLIYKLYDPYRGPTKLLQTVAPALR
jgi:hypothetical protein